MNKYAARAGMRITEVVRYESEHDNGDTREAYRDWLIGQATGTP